MTREQAARLLELRLPASHGQVKRAYRRLAREHHPDRGGDVRVFHQLQSAYERLGDADTAAPAVTGGHPSQTPATAPRAPSARELAAIAVDLTVPGAPVRLTLDLLASALARPHPAPLHPVRAASRAPGAALNRAAGVLATDLTAALTVVPTRDDRGHLAVGVEVTGRHRRARRALDTVALEGVWVRHRRGNRTVVGSRMTPATARADTAVATAARVGRLLDALAWPLSQWTLTPDVLPEARLEER